MSGGLYEHRDRRAAAVQTHAVLLNRFRLATLYQETNFTPHMNNPSNQSLSPRAWHCLQQNELALARQTRREAPDLSEIRVLDWADAFYATHGDWPRWDSGPIPGSSGETWFSVSAAFVLGQRGIGPGQSLASFFATMSEFDATWKKGGSPSARSRPGPRPGASEPADGRAFVQDRFPVKAA